MAQAVTDIAERARNKQLSPDEVQGGTFTITNPGGFGTFHGTPVISQPQAAILGTYALVKRPWVVQDELGKDVIAIRPIMNLTLTYDHRLVDGALAGGSSSRSSRSELGRVGLLGGVVAQTVVPMVAYEDAAAAIDWLTRAFGFEEAPGERYTEEDGRVTHAELRVGAGRLDLHREPDARLRLAEEPPRGVRGGRPLVRVSPGSSTDCWCTSTMLPLTPSAPKRPARGCSHRSTRAPTASATAPRTSRAIAGCSSADKARCRGAAGAGAFGSRSASRSPSPPSATARRASASRAGSEPPTGAPGARRSRSRRAASS